MLLVKHVIKIMWPVIHCLCLFSFFCKHLPVFCSVKNPVLKGKYAVFGRQIIYSWMSSQFFTQTVTAFIPQECAKPDGFSSVTNGIFIFIAKIYHSMRATGNAGGKQTLNHIMWTKITFFHRAYSMIGTYFMRSDLCKLCRCEFIVFFIPIKRSCRIRTSCHAKPATDASCVIDSYYSVR